MGRSTRVGFLGASPAVRSRGAQFVNQTERKQPLAYPTLETLLFCNADEVDLVLSPCKLRYDRSRGLVVDSEAPPGEFTKTMRPFTKTPLPFREPFGLLQQKIA